MHYVGQQHRERQGWGNKDEAEERVRPSVCVCEPVFQVPSPLSQMSTHQVRHSLHPAEQIQPPAAQTSAQDSQENVSRSLTQLYTQTFCASKTDALTIDSSNIETDTLLSPNYTRLFAPTCTDSLDLFWIRVDRDLHRRQQC